MMLPLTIIKRHYLLQVLATASEAIRVYCQILGWRSDFMIRFGFPSGITKERKRFTILVISYSKLTKIYLQASSAPQSLLCGTLSWLYTRLCLDYS
jgi:hypothetical protein